MVWLYLAEELRQFAADQQNAPLMTGRTPEGLRDQLDEGLDLRPRNWRGRHLGFLLRQTEDPWARAAVVASLLDPVEVAEIVKDPHERAHLNRLRPDRVSRAAPDSPGGADRRAHHDGGRSRRDRLAQGRPGQSLSEAREDRPVPRPTPTASIPQRTRRRRTHRPWLHGSSRALTDQCSARLATTAPRPDDRLTTPESPRSRRLLGWLRRRNPDAVLPTAP